MGTVDVEIVYCKIYPGIGIARMGNSPDQYFIGPETPGLGPEPGTQFQDAQGNVKRQGARFRVYGFNAADEVVGEVNALIEGASVEWSVTLANRKCSSQRFAGVSHGTGLDLKPDPGQNRNKSVADRAQLDIMPSARSIAGTNRFGQQYSFDDGAFMGQSVYLGELRTDDAGRLIVLGGRGKSGSVAGARPITQYANNDGWFDDSSDGPVQAKVSLGGRAIPLRGAAWVLVAPPKFAPYVRNVVTLYDVMAEAGGAPAPDTLSFTDHIFPHLHAIGEQQWVNAMALRGHGPQKGGNFLAPAVIEKMNDNSAANAPYRQSIMARLRNPSLKANQEANYNFMPQLSGDEGDAAVGNPSTWLSLPPSVYALFERWSKGDFDSDWSGKAAPVVALEMLPPQEQPGALDRAALEWCVGGPFFPGIEITYIARNRSLYSEPFRVNGTLLEPGDLTRRMAVPWQADFYECNTHWWPAQRPDDVLSESTYLQALADYPEEVRAGTLARALTDRVRWDRGVGDHWVDPEIQVNAGARPPKAGDNAMVSMWHALGFVVPVHTGAGETLQVERGRSKYDGMGDRDYFFYLLNIDSYPDFVPKARELAETFLARARALLDDPTPGAIDDVYRFFKYSSESLGQRLDEIYALYQSGASDDPFSDPDLPFRTRDDMVERIRQFAPLNQMDGAWLRNVAKAGPIDEVGALLFTIWMDEVGDGTPGQNHANVYTALLAQMGLQLAPVSTRDYANNPAMLDSAYTVPVFELAISQFTEAFFPEILGMTLQLEWEVLGLWPTVKLLRHFNIDSHFYELHIGIDNAANGHGAKARLAVERFLDEARKRGGDVEVQAVWRRIWTGYAAFATTGTLGTDLRQLLESRRRQPPTPADNVAAIMMAKKSYGNLNHGTRKLGPHRINDMFEDPEAFQQALVDAGHIIPGHPEQSPFFRLTSFEGPMYKVFTDAELATWSEWTVWLGRGGSVQPVEHDPATLMRSCIDHFRDQQKGSTGHDTVNLAGKDPGNPDLALTQSLSAWFDEPTAVLMAVLADPTNGYVIAGDSAHSPFVVKVLVASNAMTRAFDGVAPNTGGKTWRQIATGWIDAGCPLPPVDTRARALPGALAVAGPRLALTAPRSALDVHPRGNVQGMGVVH